MVSIDAKICCRTEGAETNEFTKMFACGRRPVHRTNRAHGNAVNEHLGGTNI